MGIVANSRPTKVSVIIGVYNRKDLLPQAVASVFATGYPALEIVIADDGSTDGSLDIATDLAGQHPEVKVVQHPDRGNHGVGPTKNLGIREASGDYVCFLDSDDFMMPHRFAVCVPILDADPAVDGVHEGTSALREAGGESRTGVPACVRLDCSEPEQVLERILTGFGAWTVNSIIVRKRVLVACGCFSEKLRRGQDTVLWLKLAMTARLVKGAEEPVAVYRLHHDNISTTEPTIYFFTALNSYLEAYDWAGNSTVPTATVARLRRSVMDKCFFGCAGCRKLGRPDLVPSLLSRTARAIPAILLQRKFWGNLLLSIKERAVMAKA